MLTRSPILVVITLTFTPTPVRANDPTMEGAFWRSVTLGIPATVSGVVATTGNLVAVIRERRSTRWAAFGIIAGILNFGLGVGMLGEGLGADDAMLYAPADGQRDFIIRMGVFSVVVGTASIGASFWNLRQSSRIAIVPTGSGMAARLHW